MKNWISKIKLNFNTIIRTGKIIMKWNIIQNKNFDLMTALLLNLQDKPPLVKAPQSRGLSISQIFPGSLINDMEQVWVKVRGTHVSEYVQSYSSTSP